MIAVDNERIPPMNDRHEDGVGQTSGSGGDGSHKRVSWNSSVLFAKDVVEEVKDALDDQATRLGR